MLITRIVSALRQFVSSSSSPTVMSPPEIHPNPLPSTVSSILRKMQVAVFGNEYGTRRNLVFRVSREKTVVDDYAQLVYGRNQQWLADFDRFFFRIAHAGFRVESGIFSFQRRPEFGRCVFVGYVDRFARSFPRNARRGNVGLVRPVV